MADPLTIAAIALGAGAMGGSIYSGEQGKKQQKQSLRMQQQQQREAEARATSQQRRSEQEMARANAKKPDISAIMQAAQESSRAGAASTMLTGPRGVDPNALQLGRTSLLGE
jgi:transcription initiation factor TFIID subunit TAF12